MQSSSACRYVYYRIYVGETLEMGLGIFVVSLTSLLASETECHLLGHPSPGVLYSLYIYIYPDHLRRGGGSGPDRCRFLNYTSPHRDVIYHIIPDHIIIRSKPCSVVKP